MAVATSTLIAGSLAGLQLAGAYNESVALGQQAGQERVNGEIASRMAKIREKDALEIGAERLSKFRRDAARFKGSQKAGIAAGGVSVNTGVAKALQEETELLMIEDEARIKNNTMLEAWGYKTQGQNALLQSKYNAKALENRAGSTLLSGVANAGVGLYNATAKVPTTSEYDGFGGARSTIPSAES